MSAWGPWGWLGIAASDSTAALSETRAWLAAERDARIAELEAQLAASEDEKRRFQRMYGKASVEIGRGRAELARERQARAETVLTGAQTAAVEARLSWGPTLATDPADTATALRTHLGYAWVEAQGPESCRAWRTEDPGWMPSCVRFIGHGGQHVNTSDVGEVLAVWPNPDLITADEMAVIQHERNERQRGADAALVATAEHLGNEVGPDRTATIEGAAETLVAGDRVSVMAPDGLFSGWHDAIVMEHTDGTLVVEVTG